MWCSSFSPKPLSAVELASDPLDTPKRVTANPTLRVTAAPAAALSEGRAGDLLRQHPMYKGAVDGCLGRNAQFVDDKKKLPLCQYRIEQNRFLAILSDFGAAARTW